MKKMFLIVTEIRSNKSTIMALIIQMIFAILCYNICMVTLENHVGTILYFGGINTDNSISVYCPVSMDNNYGEILNMENAGDGFYTKYYLSDLTNGDNIVAEKSYIAAISDSILSSENIYLSKGQINALIKKHDLGISVLVTEDLLECLPEGSIYTLENGIKIYIAGSIKNNTIHYICSAMTSEPFILTIDCSELNGLNRHSLDSIFLTLKNNCIDETVNKINETYENFSAVKFDLDLALSSNYSKMATLLVFGFIILIISVIGFFSNNYFTYKKNEIVYNQYKILGANRSTLFIILLGVHLFEIFTAVIISAIVLFAGKKIIGVQFVTLNSFIISILIFVLMIIISLILCLRKNSYTLV